MVLVKRMGFAAMFLVAVSSMALAQSSGGAGSGSSTGPATGGGAPGVGVPGTGAAPGASGATGGSGLGGTATTPGGSAADAQSPRAAPNGTQQLTERTVKQTLEAQGFTQVQNVQRTKNGFTALAMKNGQSHRVGIDQTGRVVMMN